MKIVQTGIRKWFEGTNLTIFVTYRCNLPCPYCSLKITIPDKCPKPGIELSADEWVKRVETFPVKLRDIYLTGGEPTLYNDLSRLCNMLLTRGYHVLVFSNLFKVDRLLKINPSRKFKIEVTYHKDFDKCDNVKRFDNSYKTLQKNYRITVDEFESTNYKLPNGNVLEIGHQIFSYSILKRFDNEERWKIPNFRYSADGKLFTCVYDHVAGIAETIYGGVQ